MGSLSAGLDRDVARAESARRERQRQQREGLDDETARIAADIQRRINEAIKPNRSMNRKISGDTVPEGEIEEMIHQATLTGTSPSRRQIAEAAQRERERQQRQQIAELSRKIDHEVENERLINREAILEDRTITGAVARFVYDAWQQQDFDFEQPVMVDPESDPALRILAEE